VTLNNQRNQDGKIAFTEVGKNLIKSSTFELTMEIRGLLLMLRDRVETEDQRVACSRSNSWISESTENLVMVARIFTEEKNESTSLPAYPSLKNIAKDRFCGTDLLLFQCPKPDTKLQRYGFGTLCKNYGDMSLSQRRGLGLDTEDPRPVRYVIRISHDLI
jgi:hypothetical protein